MREEIKNMKRFSVLLVALFCLGLIITNSSKADSTPDNMAQEILKDAPGKKDQSATTEKDCSANTDVTFVSDTNVSDKRETYGTDNKANLRELYYKDGYIYFKYIMAKGDTINVGGVTYVQTNKVKIETKLIQKSPAFEQRTDEDYTYTDGEPYSGSAILSIKEFNEDFGRVYVGELTEEDAKKYMGITAVVTMYYDSSDKLHDGLSMTRSVEYSIDRW